MIYLPRDNKKRTNVLIISKINPFDKGIKPGFPEVFKRKEIGVLLSEK